MPKTTTASTKPMPTTTTADTKPKARKVPPVTQPTHSPIDQLIVQADDKQRECIENVLQQFPLHLVQRAAKANVRIFALQPKQRYNDISPVLARLAAGVDNWPIPPAGLTVIEERAIYLRDTDGMTMAHEFGHVIDMVIGNGIYISGIRHDIRKAFETARSFITPYSASGLDEYFAEGCRAMVGINRETSLWPLVSRDRLQQIDPVFYGILDKIFAERAPLH